jgi:hypothetical protein
VYHLGGPNGLAVLGHELVHVVQYSEGMTAAKYLWSVKFGYNNSIYEKVAYNVQARIVEGLTAKGFSGCTKPQN